MVWLPPASCTLSVLSMTSTGNEGLVASVRGTSTRKLTITVHEIAATFDLHENFRKKTMPSRRPNTTICGLVSTAADKASQAHIGWRRSASSTAARTKKMLTTCVWPHTDMLNHTAGLKRKEAAAMRLQRSSTL